MGVRRKFRQCGEYACLAVFAATIASEKLNWMRLGSNAWLAMWGAFRSYWNYSDLAWVQAYLIVKMWGGRGVCDASIR